MKIGDFARLGQVSVRMLRHYDAIGLLRPAAVDSWTGYRSYTSDQLATLHRVVALKELGLSLDQVGQLLTDELGPDELRGMLRRRRRELAAEVTAARAGLASVEHRLHLIEKEHTMSNVEYVTKSLPARRLAGRTATIGDDQSVAEVVGPLFDEVSATLGSVGACAETGVAVYDLADGAMRVTTGYDYAGAPAPGFDVVELPPVGRAVCGVHLGPTDGIPKAWADLDAWLRAQQLEPSGPCREVYLEADTPDQSDWVTELQQPVRISASR